MLRGNDSRRLRAACGRRCSPRSCCRRIARQRGDWRLCREAWRWAPGRRRRQGEARRLPVTASAPAGSGFAREQHNGRRHGRGVERLQPGRAAMVVQHAMQRQGGRRKGNGTVLSPDLELSRRCRWATRRAKIQVIRQPHERPCLAGRKAKRLQGTRHTRPRPRVGARQQARLLPLVQHPWRLLLRPVLGSQAVPRWPGVWQHTLRHAHEGHTRQDSGTWGPNTRGPEWRHRQLPLVGGREVQRQPGQGSQAVPRHRRACGLLHAGGRPPRWRRRGSVDAPLHGRWGVRPPCPQGLRRPQWPPGRWRGRSGYAPSRGYRAHLPPLKNLKAWAGQPLRRQLCGCPAVRGGGRWGLCPCCAAMCAPRPRTGCDVLTSCGGWRVPRRAGYLTLQWGSGAWAGGRALRLVSVRGAAGCPPLVCQAAASGGVHSDPHCLA